MIKRGYRELQRPSLYREWHEPLFHSSVPTRTGRALKVIVWADEAPGLGAQVTLEVLRLDGSLVESLAEVTWVEPQPRGAPAPYRLGLCVFAQSEPALEVLESLLSR